MKEVRKCDCGKWVSADLAFCWNCWNEMGNKEPKIYCKCGVDVSPNEDINECKHQEPTEHSARMTAEQYKHIEFWCATTAETDGSWMELELAQARDHLLKQIDIALENGAEHEFMELTAKLNGLMEMA